MKKQLERMLGRKVDLVFSSSSSLRGELVSVDGDVVHLKDDHGRECFAAIEHIDVVWEVRDEIPRAGFVSPVT